LIRPVYYYIIIYGRQWPRGQTGTGTNEPNSSGGAAASAISSTLVYTIIYLHGCRRRSSRRRRRHTLYKSKNYSY